MTVSILLLDALMLSESLSSRILLSLCCFFLQLNLHEHTYSEYIVIKKVRNAIVCIVIKLHSSHVFYCLLDGNSDSYYLNI